MGPFWRLSEGESVLSLSFWWLKFLWHIWRRQWHPTPVLLPGKSHGRRSLVGCSPWGHEELDMTERFHFHFSLSCIGEGNGNPLQCSCLENPRDRGAWWAAIFGVIGASIVFCPALTALEQGWGKAGVLCCTQLAKPFSDLASTPTPRCPRAEKPAQI